MKDNLKFLGIPVFGLALVVGILPQFTECAGVLKLANGMTAPMRCHWTAIAEMALSVPLAVLGVLLFINKKNESRRSLSILGALLGTFVVLLPTTLIGVCKSNMMACRNLMLPALVISGGLIVVASIVFFASSFRKIEPIA
jgi:predicted membrane channel-forming protein YqfA (hemolysin III family)